MNEPPVAWGQIQHRRTLRDRSPTSAIPAAANSRARREIGEEDRAPSRTGEERDVQGMRFDPGNREARAAICAKRAPSVDSESRGPYASRAAASTSPAPTACSNAACASSNSTASWFKASSSSGPGTSAPTAATRCTKYAACRSRAAARRSSSTRPATNARTVSSSRNRRPARPGALCTSDWSTSCASRSAVVSASASATAPAAARSKAPRNVLSASRSERSSSASRRYDQSMASASERWSAGPSSRRVRGDRPTRFELFENLRRSTRACGRRRARPRAVCRRACGTRPRCCSGRGRRSTHRSAPAIAEHANRLGHALFVSGRDFGGQRQRRDDEDLLAVHAQCLPTCCQHGDTGSATAPGGRRSRPSA